MEGRIGGRRTVLGASASYELGNYSLCKKYKYKYKYVYIYNMVYKLSSGMLCVGCFLLRQRTNMGCFLTRVLKSVWHCLGIP